MRSPLKNTGTLLWAKRSHKKGRTLTEAPVTLHQWQKFSFGKEQTALEEKVLRRYNKYSQCQSQGEVMAGWRGMREVNLSIFGSVGFCQSIQGNAKRGLLFSGCMHALEPDYAVRWAGSFEFKENIDLNCRHSVGSLVGICVQLQIRN